MWIRFEIYKVNQTQSWISLEMSGPPPLCTPDRKGECQPNSVFHHFGNVRAAPSLPWHFQTDSTLIFGSPLTLPVMCAERMRPRHFQTDSTLNLVALSPFLSCVKRGGGPDISRLIQDWILLPLTLPVRCAERRRPWHFQTDSRLNHLSISFMRSNVLLYILDFFKSYSDLTLKCIFQSASMFLNFQILLRSLFVCIHTSDQTIVRCQEIIDWNLNQIWKKFDI